MAETKKLIATSLNAGPSASRRSGNARPASSDMLLGSGTPAMSSVIATAKMPSLSAATRARSTSSPRFSRRCSTAPPAPLPEWFAHGGDAMSKAIEGKILATVEGRGITAITGRRITIAQLVQALEDQLRAPIHDQTGLTGQYYFGFKSIRVDAPPDADANSAILAPTLFDALRESLGLQLEKRTVPVDMLIVDHVEKSPTEN